MKASEIAQMVRGEFFGEDVAITSVADISSAEPGQLAFFEKDTELPETAASCVIVKAAQAETRPVGSVPELQKPALSKGINVIRSPNPKLAFAKAAKALKNRDERTGTHPSASIADTATVHAAYIGPNASIGDNSKVGDGVRIHDGASIGRNVTVGDGTEIFPNTVIYDNVEIGDSCVIHAGTVIGADGFGYVRDETGVHHQFPQIGTVVIEDNVEIGANSTIDRGALGETRIGEGTKLDNMVHVGHNCSIGKRCVIAAQTGISGSVTIEDDCVIGGQVGFGDHVRVQSGAVIGSQAGVLPGKIVRPGVWWGTPIQPLDEYKRQNAHVKALERIRADIKKLKDAVFGGGDQ